MKNEIVLLIGIGATLIASVISIYVGWRNLRTTKYIDTITSSRIKWIDITRNEITELTVNIFFTIKIYRAVIEQRQSDFTDNDSTTPNYEPYVSYFDAKTTDALANERNIWSESDFIQKATLIKLRLNQIEDKSIIEILDFFIAFYKNMQLKSENDINIADQKVNQLIEHTQILLKKEWEKCKTETKKN